jgi:sigma-B regulation protein RsbU (phosphoserine phosphatase)
MSDADALASLIDTGDYQYAPCGHLVTAPDGRILRVNETMVSLTGYAREDLVERRRFSELLSVGGRIYHETHLAPMLRMQGTASEIALELVRADGARVPVLVNFALQSDAEGHSALIRIAVFAATDRRNYEQELLRAKERAEASEQHATTLARTLQHTLIPPALPDIEGLDIAAAYRPAGDGEEVGGDFYDVFEIGTDDWTFVIGDVCGKGVEAAVVTALARHTLRAAAVRSRRPSAILDTLNQVLLQHQTDRFCTAIVLRVQRAGDRWQIQASSGGHPLPILIRHGQPPTDLGKPGTLVGILEEPVFINTETTLEPDDALLLYTDGVTEGQRDGTGYGEERLHAAMLAHLGDAATLCEGVLADALAFQRHAQRDDIAILTLTNRHHAVDNTSG